MQFQIIYRRLKANIIEPLLILKPIFACITDKQVRYAFVQGVNDFKKRCFLAFARYGAEYEVCFFVFARQNQSGIVRDPVYFTDLTITPEDIRQANDVSII